MCQWCWRFKSRRSLVSGSVWRCGRTKRSGGLVPQTLVMVVRNMELHTKALRRKLWPDALIQALEAAWSLRGGASEGLQSPWSHRKPPMRERRLDEPPSALVVILLTLTSILTSGVWGTLKREEPSPSRRRRYIQTTTCSWRHVGVRAPPHHPGVKGQARTSPYNQSRFQRLSCIKGGWSLGAKMAAPVTFNRMKMMKMMDQLAVTRRGFNLQKVDRSQEVCTWS